MRPLRFVGRAGGEIDRDPQHLPLALGGLALAHRPGGPGRRRQWWRRRWPLIAMTAGSASVVAGAVLSATRPAVPVFALGTTVHVGASILDAVPGKAGEYRGDAALLMTQRPDGAIQAASSTVSRGTVTTASCVMTHPSSTSLEERCQFRINAQPLRAVDRLNVAGDGEWHRRYDDGQEIRIAVPAAGAVVPVPFAIGR